MKIGDLSLYLTSYNTQENRHASCLGNVVELALPLTWAVLESWFQWHECRRAVRLTNILVQIHMFELAHPNINSIYELLM